MENERAMPIVIKPVVSGLDDYMAKVERLAGVLNEAVGLYGQIRDAELTVGYEIEPIRTS